MAFTTAQAMQIRTYCGYSSLYLYLNPRLEGAITTVGNDVDGSALALGYVANVLAVLNDIQAMALPSAGVKSLDKGDVELYDKHAQIEGKKMIGRMWVGLLSALFGVPVAADIFDGRGYRGDGWAKGQVGRLSGMG